MASEGLPFWQLRSVYQVHYFHGGKLKQAVDFRHMLTIRKDASIFRGDMLGVLPSNSSLHHNRYHDRPRDCGVDAGWGDLHGLGAVTA